MASVPYSLQVVNSICTPSQRMCGSKKSSIYAVQYLQSFGHITFFPPFSLFCLPYFSFFLSRLPFPSLLAPFLPSLFLISFPPSVPSHLSFSSPPPFFLLVPLLKNSLSSIIYPSFTSYPPVGFSFLLPQLLPSFMVCAHAHTHTHTHTCARMHTHNVT